MKVDENGYEIFCYRVVWYFRMGWIEDSEGRTWAEKLHAEAAFPTREAAELHREHHPDCFKDPWEQWRTKYDYGQIGIFRVEEPIDNSIFASVWDHGYNARCNDEEGNPENPTRNPHTL